MRGMRGDQRVRKSVFVIATATKQQVTVDKHRRHSLVQLASTRGSVAEVLARIQNQEEPAGGNLNPRFNTPKKHCFFKKSHLCK